MIKRVLFDELKAHLSKKEISLIAGPRQAGKTTLMRALIGHLEKNGEKTVFLNLDIEADKRFFHTQEDLIRKIKLEIGKGKGYVFIDEIQRKADAGLFLKGIYDMALPYKFVVSGSGSIELKERIHESLAGRKRIFELNTLSFEEFVNYKTEYRYEDKLPDFFDVERGKAKELLDEYMTFGGYPRVVLEDELREKREVIKEIYQSYVEKDVYSFLGIHKTEAFDNLLRLLASQTGGLTNLSELSGTLGISLPTVKNYLWYLEKTFILQKVSPFFKNVRKEITKSPVYYFYDTGLRNYSAGIFGNIVRLEEAGFLFQNFVLNSVKEGLRAMPHRINFWRTKDGAEVDFIVSFQKSGIPVEVKYKAMKEPVVGRSLRSYISKYKPELVLIVNLSLDESSDIDDTKVRFIPFYRLMELDRIVKTIQ